MVSHIVGLGKLCQVGADVTTTDENECTALHWAADQGHPEVSHASNESFSSISVFSSHLYKRI